MPGILRSGSPLPLEGWWVHRPGAARWVLTGAYRVGLQPSIWGFSDPRNSGLSISSSCRYHVPSSFHLRSEEQGPPLAGCGPRPGRKLGGRPSPGAIPPVGLGRHTEPSCGGPFPTTLSVPFGRTNQVGRWRLVVWPGLGFKASCLCCRWRSCVWVRVS